MGTEPISVGGGISILLAALTVVLMMRSLSVAHRTFAVPRAGSDEADYEDAVAIGTVDGGLSAAVADGATESVFARTWAECLTRGLVEQGATTPEALRTAVADWQKKWRAAAHDRAEARPWYVEAKAAEGAFAALLGLSLGTGGKWRTVSVGDCCLFQVRDGGLLRSWPFDEAEAFTNRPTLVPSHPTRALPTVEATSGAWTPGDIFLLATDAVASWLLNPSSSAGPATVAAWDEEQFRRAVDRARAAETLRNDDATLLVIDTEKTPSVD